MDKEKAIVHLTDAYLRCKAMQDGRVKKNYDNIFFVERRIEEAVQELGGQL